MSVQVCECSSLSSVQCSSAYVCQVFKSVSAFQVCKCSSLSSVQRVCQVSFQVSFQVCKCSTSVSVQV